MSGEGNTFFGRPSIMTPTEQRFFAVLEPLIRGRFSLSGQVRLLSIVGVAKGSRFGTKSKIDKKSVDFLLSDIQTGETRLVIELDDWTHGLPDRIERDRFVDEVLAQAGIPVLHVKVQSDYAETELLARIEEALTTPQSHNDFTFVKEENVSDTFVELATKTASVVNRLAEDPAVRKAVGVAAPFVFRRKKRRYAKKVGTSCLSVLIFFIFLAILSSFLNTSRPIKTGAVLSNGPAQRTIPLNAHKSYTTNGWQCDTGYKEAGNGCEKIFVPEHALFIPPENWVCEKQYIKVDNGCRLVEVPAHGVYSYGENWYCEYGYVKEGNTCKEIIVPPHGHLSGISWYCEYGYVKKGDACEEIIVPTHAHLSGTSWYCDLGYKVSGETCIPK